MPGARDIRLNDNHQNNTQHNGTQHNTAFHQTIQKHLTLRPSA
jgi:hypothetical protein